jgi:nicotinamide mononucleotide (NMN) deamidase PncC
MSQPLIDSATLLGQLEQSGLQAVIVSTGGGSQAISHLLSTPGASSVVLECLVPYARQAVDRLLGGPQESFCSSRTARRLAMMAWQRACGLGATPATALGAAVTASLRSRGPKRGQHRIVAATHRLDATTSATLVLHKGARSRADEESVAAALLLERLAATAGGPIAPASPTSLHLLQDEHVEIECCEPPPSWRELFAGTRTSVHVSLDPSRPQTTVSADGLAAEMPAAGMLVFPGSFELSVTNVDKPSLDYLEMQLRVSQFAGRSLWLTRAATFAEKVDVFPASTFVLGADTYSRLADPKYYGGSAEAADRAAQRIAGQARGLIVFGRERDGVFEDPSRLDVPRSLRELTYFVSQREFRMDISSTELRRRCDVTE